MNYEELENFLQRKIFPELEKGRASIDKAHTKSVAIKIKEIVKNTPALKIDYPVLIIAAYAHDWGYSELFENGKALKLSDVANTKEKHMVAGAKKLKNLLKDPFFNALSQKQKNRAIHLVKTHDRLDQLKDIDELLLMEADSLGGLDIEHVTFSFDKESKERFLKNSREKRLPKFITDWGKKEFKRLFLLRQKYDEG